MRLVHVVALLLLGNVSACGSAESASVADQRNETRSRGSPLSARGGAAQPPGIGRWYAPSSPFNTPIPRNARTVAKSSAYIQTLFAWANGWNVNSRAFGVTVFYSRAATPRVNVALANNSAINGVPIPRAAKPAAGDGHMMIIDISTGCEYDFHEAAQQSNGGWSASGEATFRIGKSGVHTPWSARASGFALGAGLIRPKEVREGVIRHALVFGYGLTSPQHVSPATTSDGRTAGGLPMGSRVQLDPKLDLARSEPPLMPWQRMIAQALQTYGMFLADTSSSLALYAVSTESSPGLRYPWEGQWMRTDLIPHMRVVAPPRRPPALDTGAGRGCVQRPR